MRRSDYAWMAIGTAVLAYEACTDYDDLLSCAVDRYLARHPQLTRAVVIVTAAHLLNWLPERIDPYHGFGVMVLKTKAARHVVR